MQFYLAQDMGMCKGLRLIMHRTSRELANANGEAVYLFRELVHNDQAHEFLLRNGVTAQVFQPEDIPDNSKVIVGPHSAPPSTLIELSKRTKLVDTSCRDVMKVLDVAKSFASDGYQVVFIGKPDHEEAEMIQSAICDALVVSTEQDISKLPTGITLGLVSQSTQTQEKYFELANKIKEAGHQARIGMTVCKETHRRQQAVLELAKQVDKIIVIGGKRSNNTLALAITASKYVPTWHISNAHDLESTWFSTTDRVGITAGASTPDFVINNVLRRLQEIGDDLTTEQRGKPAWVSNNFRRFRARLRTAMLDRFLAIIEWVQYLRGRNPTDIEGRPYRAGYETHASDRKKEISEAFLSRTVPRHNSLNRMG